MIKETEHFILDYKQVNDTFNNKCILSPEEGLVIKVKITEVGPIDLLYIIPNKQIKFMTDPGSHLETVGTMLQDTITSWELWVELAQLLDEADYIVGMSVVNKDFDKYLD